MAMKIELIRPDDLLHLRIEASNLLLDKRDPGNPVLRVQDKRQDAFLSVTFPPQTVAEAAYFEYSIVAPPDDEGNKREDPDADKTDSEPLDPPGEPNPDQGRHTAAMLGRPSRLVFRVPPDVRIPYSIAGLLDWSKLEPSVSPIAAIDATSTAQEIANAPAIAEPTAVETAIELPYRLVISPNRNVAWKHAAKPRTSRGRTELWHTRLVRKDGVRVSELTRNRTAPLRAIWSLDYHPRPPTEKKDEELGRTAMSPNDRHQIVVLTSAFHGYQVDVDVTIKPDTKEIGSGLVPGPLRPIPLKLTVPYVPQPFDVEQLMLSPLGGWLKSRGHWAPPREAPPVIFPDLNPGDLLNLLDVAVSTSTPVPTPPTAKLSSEATLSVTRMQQQPKPYQLDLSEWVHAATLGRDHYVRIVYEGELWPFRHRAALIKVTERKFKEVNGIVGAYLMQRNFIVVREPEKTFTNRDNPFQRVRLTTLVTPDIADPDENKVKGTNRSFWVEVMTGAPNPELFQFHAVGTDAGGNAVDFTVPLMFVSISDVGDTDKLKQVADEYNNEPNITRRGASLFGQKVSFAPPDPSPDNRNDNTTLVTQSLNFVVDAAGNSPRMLKAEVKIPQVQELLGTDAATTIRYFPGYVSNDFVQKSGVFAQIVKEDLSMFNLEDPLATMVPDTLAVDFSADKAGGFATPNLSVSTLTRAWGPLAGTVENADNGAFVAKEFFPPGTATLFGCFDLSELLPTGSLDQSAPKLMTTTENVDDAKTVITNIEWMPLTLNVIDKPIAKFEPLGGRLSVKGTIRKPVDPGESTAGEATSEFVGSLTSFRVNVLNSVSVNFREFSFAARTGQKPEVKVDLDLDNPLGFDGDLKFVEEIRKAIPPNLFGDGPSLDITPSGVRAGFAIGLPPLEVGVFALKDVSLGAALTLPFLDGKPVFDFNVSERAHHFLLAVGIFGGGGFFHLQLDTAGIKQLEAALEFGATAALNIGVASGEVHIMAGIYFSLQTKEGTTELAPVLSGYMRMGGSLCVIGLVRVSVEFNLSFTYDGGKDKAFGRATLTVEVEVAFFSKSVELTVERGFGGSGDPKFEQLFDTSGTWKQYASAFA